MGADIIVPLHDEAFDVDSIESPILQRIDKALNNLKQNTNNKERAKSGFSLHYLNSFLSHSNFNILLHGASIEYNRILQNAKTIDTIFTYQINFADVTMRKNSGAIDKGASIGTFVHFDILFGQTLKGYHTIGIDIGYGAGIPRKKNSEFNEHSLLLNFEYGYSWKRSLKYGEFSFMPYIGVESYVFFPVVNRIDSYIDGGMNAIIGVKNIWDIPWIECGLLLGALSDLNVSGSSVGILGNSTIVYDKGGMSNGIFAEINIGILQYKNFHILAKTNISYMLSYYEVNVQSDISILYRF